MGVIENRIDITELERSGGGGGGTAASVSYDNATSHMTATDVQAALDELSLDIVEGLALVDTSVAANRAAITATQGIIAPVEDGETSDHAYAIGAYIIHQNAIMRVTAAIAIGDTFTIGTNIAAADDIMSMLVSVPQTNADITNVNTDYITINEAYYSIVNGICFMRVSYQVIQTTTDVLRLGTYPKSKLGVAEIPTASFTGTGKEPYSYMDGNSGVAFVALNGVSVGQYRASIVYPVDLS